MATAETIAKALGGIFADERRQAVADRSLDPDA